jgi:hypothetical protein
MVAKKERDNAEMEETKRIMERLVNTPHKLHKDEPSHKARPTSKPRAPKGKTR